jgi:hypothetical protein
MKTRNRRAIRAATSTLILIGLPIGCHHPSAPSVTRENFNRIQKRMDDEIITVKEMEAIIGPHEKTTVIHAEPVMDLVYQWSGPEGNVIVRSDGEHVSLAMFRSNDGIDTVKSAFVNKIIMREATVFERVTGWLWP